MKKSAPRGLVHILVRGGHKKRLLLFVVALVILSIVALSYFCPENLCRQEKSSSSSSSVPWISSDFANNNSPSFSSSTHQSEANDVDRVLDRTFGYDFDRYQRFRLSKTYQISFDDMLASPNENAFHIKGNDVMVFLHMQKTGKNIFIIVSLVLKSIILGGSAFDRHVVRDLVLEQSCKCEPKRKKKCRCFRPDTNNKYWLFSRYSIGWKCGLHADYTVYIFVFIFFH